MTNLIRKAKRKVPEVTIIQWDGTEESVAELKPLLAKFDCGVFYIGKDDWHHTLTPDEVHKNWYYDPFLVLSYKRNDIRVEKDQYIVLHPGDTPNLRQVYITTENDMRDHYEFLPEDPVEDRPAGDEVVPEAGQEEDHDNGSEGPREELPAGSEGPGETGGETSEEEEQEVTDPEPITHEPVPTPETEETLEYDNAPNDDQAEGSDYRAVEDLVGHGDGELRERDSLGGESGEAEHEDESNV